MLRGCAGNRGQGLGLWGIAVGGCWGPLGCWGAAVLPSIALSRMELGGLWGAEPHSGAHSPIEGHRVLQKGAQPHSRAQPYRRAHSPIVGRTAL